MAFQVFPLPHISPPRMHSSSSHTCRMPHPSHSFLDLITQVIFGEHCKSWSSSLCNCLQFPFTSSLLDSNIFLSTQFPNTFSLCPSANMTDQVSHTHTHKRRGKIILLCHLIFIFLHKGKTTDLCSHNCSFHCSVAKCTVTLNDLCSKG